MKIQLYKFTGLSPLLMVDINSIQRISESGVSPPKLGTAPNAGDYEKIADMMAYKNDDGSATPPMRHGSYYMPTQALRTSLLTGCVGQKFPGTRVGPARIFQSLIFPCEEQADLTNPKGKPIMNHEIQIDSGVNKANKARIILVRPRVNEWEMVVPFEIDEEFAPPNFDQFMGALLSIWNRAGRAVGIGAWRPECKGRHGRYSVEQV